jgi:molecular chaperone DnaJ
MGPGMVQQVLSQCPRCKGSGNVAARGEDCIVCSGEGYKTELAEIHLPVPAGVPDGVTIALRGEGGTIPKAEPGDLHVHVKTLQHAVFKRRGNDLLVSKEISLSEALLGVSLQLTLLDGRTISVLGPKGHTLQHGAVLKVGGEGLPSHNGSARGDVFIFLSVALPQTLTSDQQEALAKAFGKPPANSNEKSKQVTGKLLRESAEQLKQMKEAQWAAQEAGDGDRRGQSRRGSGRGEQQQQACHAQ